MSTLNEGHIRNNMQIKTIEKPEHTPNKQNNYKHKTYKETSTKTKKRELRKAKERG